MGSAFVSHRDAIASISDEAFRMGRTPSNCGHMTATCDHVAFVQALPSSVGGREPAEMLRMGTFLGIDMQLPGGVLATTPISRCS